MQSRGARPPPRSDPSHAFHIAGAARRDGTLANLWAQANAAAYDVEDAKVGLEQCAKSFRATEAAADLTAAILSAASK